MDLKKIKLSDEVLSKAKEYSKGKTYKRSMRGEQGTNVGAIGEYVAKDYLEGFGLAVSDNRGTETATQYDFLVNGKSVEVKTKDRTVPPKSFYECSVPLYNHSHQKPDWFIFLSLHRIDTPYMDDSWYEDAYILGMTTYDFIEKEGITVMKGEVDESNGWMCKESCINLPIDKLSGVEQFILELNSI